MATNLGQATIKGVLIISCDTTPITAGLSAPIGSFSLASDGSGMFYKNGSGNSAWISPFPTGVSGQIPVFNGTNTFAGYSTFTWDSTNDILKLGSSTIAKTTMGGITTNALEFRSASTIGISSFRPFANGACRFYLMPNITTSVTGTTAKFEIFNTDYSTGSPNYNAFNIFCNNTQNTIWLGGNVAGSATRLKMVIAGKFNASVVDAGSSRIDFETNEDITINTTGGNVGIKQTSPLEALHVNGNIRLSGVVKIGAISGVSGSFTTVDNKTITVTGGIVTSIV